MDLGIKSIEKSIIPKGKNNYEKLLNNLREGVRKLICKLYALKGIHYVLEKSVSSLRVQSKSQ